MDIGGTVVRPFQEEIDYKTIILAAILIAIVAFAAFDALRILKSWVASAS